MTNKFEHTLFLECRGCYFHDSDKLNKLSDVGNHRVGCYNYPIKSKDGRTYILEFITVDKKDYRYTNKRTGKQLKKPIYELVLENALHIDTEFEDEKGLSWRNSTLEREIYSQNYTYTKSNILNVVNSISIKKYNNIVLVSSEKIIDRLSHIYNISGYREKSILNNLKEVKTKQYTKDYHVFTFIDYHNNTFDYEFNSDRITG